jgi:YebC/PmpR family DNA-binding regulatory protein
MSGHSKWASIKHKKGKLDAKRGQIFTKLIKEITVAARLGGGNPDGNPRLRAAILAAKAQNMPAENIERAIKRGTGELEGVAYEEATYEGYGPGGVAVLVDVTTDNKNRCVADIRRIFSKAGGTLAAAGSVAWMFDLKGLIEVDATGTTEDAVLEAALDAGAEDVRAEEGYFEVTTSPSDMESVVEALKAKGLTIRQYKLAKVPKSYVKLSGKEAEQMLRLLESLEDNDDVQNVWSNFDMDEKEMESLVA